MSGLGRSWGSSDSLLPLPHGGRSIGRATHIFILCGPDIFHGGEGKMNRFHKVGVVVLAALAIAGASVQSISAAPGTATIEVRKSLVPTNDPGLFNLLVRYTGGSIITEVFNVGNNGHTPRVSIPSATWLT